MHYVTSTLKAPRGATRLAGAMTNAAKLKASPIPTEDKHETMLISYLIDILVFVYLISYLWRHRTTKSIRVGSRIHPNLFL